MPQTNSRINWVVDRLGIPHDVQFSLASSTATSFLECIEEARPGDSFQPAHRCRYCCSITVSSWTPRVLPVILANSNYVLTVIRGSNFITR